MSTSRRRQSPLLWRWGEPSCGMWVGVKEVCLAQPGTATHQPSTLLIAHVTRYHHIIVLTHTRHAIIRLCIVLCVYTTFCHSSDEAW